jgi:citrate lyase beta subunit
MKLIYHYDYLAHEQVTTLRIPKSTLEDADTKLRVLLEELNKPGRISTKLRALSDVAEAIENTQQASAFSAK